MPDRRYGASISISIHALRKESDGRIPKRIFRVIISIHALRKESDAWRASSSRQAVLFQSTLSVRRATGGRNDAYNKLKISIHALRKESDAY